MGLTRRALLTGSLAVPALGYAIEPLAQDTGPTIKEVANANGFRFGAAAKRPSLVQPLRGLFEDECDLITPELAMKMNTVYGAEGQADFAKADEIAAWALDFGALLRVHALVFAPNAIPDWLNTRADENREAAVNIVLAYVRQMTHRYNNRVASIDIVNEALNKDTEFGGLLKDHWLYQGDGFQVISDAYAIAREENPRAELVYNETVLPYNNPGLDAERNDLIDFLTICRERDIQIDTVGIQSHLKQWRDRDFDPGVWLRFLRDIEALGYNIAITELSASDAWLTGIPGVGCQSFMDCKAQQAACDLDQALDASTVHERIRVRDAETGRAVAEYLAATLQVRSIKDIVCWGLSDATWYQNSEDRFCRDGCITEDGAMQPCIRALPYDEQREMKPMARAIMTAMEQAPPRS